MFLRVNMHQIKVEPTYVDTLIPKLWWVSPTKEEGKMGQGVIKKKIVTLVHFYKFPQNVLKFNISCDSNR